MVGNTGRPGRGLLEASPRQPPQQPVARHQPVRCYEFRRRNEKPLFVSEPPSDARAPFVLFCAGRSSGGTSLAGNKEGERGLFGCVAASLDWGFACGTEQHPISVKGSRNIQGGRPRYSKLLVRRRSVLEYVCRHRASIVGVAARPAAAAPAAYYSEGRIRSCRQGATCPIIEGYLRRSKSVGWDSCMAARHFV